MTDRFAGWRECAAAGVIGIGLVVAASVAQAGSPSICADTDVLRFIEDKYVRSQINATLLGDTVAEFPTADPGQVLCAMYVRREIFDYSKYGQWPRIELEPQTFLVKKLPVGFEVTRPR